jgi:hypothetical protein
VKEENYKYRYKGQSKGSEAMEFGAGLIELVFSFSSFFTFFLLPRASLIPWDMHFYPSKGCRAQFNK